MNTIREYLLKIRFEAVKSDLKIILWRIYSSLIILFILAITIENIFYLSSSIRMKVWIALVVIIIIFISFIFLVSIQIKKNRFKRYKLEFIAKNTGKFAFTKNDTLINALQIENTKENLYSKNLSKTFIEQTIDTLSKINISKIFPSEKIYLWKKITLICLVFTFLTIITTWKHSVSSMFRWSHAKTEFIPPKPFELVGLTRHLNVLGGENVKIIFKAKGQVPDSIFIEFKPIFNTENNDSSIIVSAQKTNIDEFEFEFKEIYQNFRYRGYLPSIDYWDAWEEITTKYFSISVTDRPSIEDFLVTITPPNYTGLKKQSQKANQAQIEAINGSKINIKLKSNRNLSFAELILDQDKKEMKIKGKTAQYEFIASLDQKFSINLMDKRGVRNRNPIPFNLQIVNDISPQMTIIQPPPIIELGSEQIIPILMSIEDDFGFSNLQLSYELERPNYIEAEPFISLFNIEINKSSKTQQDIQTIWNLESLGLMPEDEVRFHFELYDNDIVSGPKKTISSTFIVRLPSLNDLFHTFNEKQEKIVDAVKIELEDIQKLKIELDKAELNLLKKDKVEWKDNQSMKETFESVKEQLDDFQSLAEQMDQLNNNSEKHQLFSKDLMNKFEDLQQLIEEIFPQDMLKNMDWMDEALDNMKPEELLSALDQLSKNINGIEQFTGSTTSRVIKSSTIPVIAVKQKRTEPKFSKIVLPIDLTKTSKQKIDWAVKVGLKYNSTIHIIMELEKDELIERKIKANLNQAEGIFEKYGVKYESHLLDDREYPDHLGKDTIKYAEEIDADLIIIMTKSETGKLSDLFVGSYAEQIVNSSQKTPVMCINPKPTGSRATGGSGFY